ncbi:MAG TPA: helix-turn-helix domain-containing protein [Stellaceae bacterium]|nr:helix-turn-helix domain-containing protein [Stellaceae bacterium]
MLSLRTNLLPPARQIAGGPPSPGPSRRAGTAPAYAGATPSEDEEHYCPHCGGPLTRRPKLLQHPCFDDFTWAVLPPRSGDMVPPPRRLSPQLWRILSAFRGAFGRTLGRAYLNAHAQFRKGEDADPKTLDVRLCHLRKALDGTPFAIEGVWGQGWRLTYRVPARSEARD